MMRSDQTEMPGHSSLSSISAGVSLTTVLTSLWIAERLLSPILELEQCRRGIHASLMVASTLSNNIARLAGRGDVDTLNSLRETRKDLARKADWLSSFQTRSSITLKVYVGVRGYDLPEAARALMRLGVSLFASTRERLADRAAVEAGLKLRPCQIIPPE
jgi:hypothetical protein